MSAVRTTREVIADAANDAEYGDINVTPYYRQSTKPGDGCVRLDRVVRAENGFGSMTTWQVVVWLPTDQVDAEVWIDEHLTQLMAALGTEGVVTAAQPVQMQIDSGSAPALVVDVVRGTEE